VYEGIYNWGVTAENEYSSLQYTTTAQFRIQSAPTDVPPASQPRRPTPPDGPGYSVVEISNCHADHRSVHVWLREWPRIGAITTNYLGELKDQHNDSGRCPFDNVGQLVDPFTIPVEVGHKLESGSVYEVFCTDPDANGCTVEANNEVIVDTQVCVRLNHVIRGDRDGETFRFYID
jgi:hypothetical protein